MSGRYIVLIILSILLIIVEIYCYSNIKIAIKGHRWNAFFSYIYWTSLIFTLIMLSIGILLFLTQPMPSIHRTWTQNFFIGITATLIFSKLILALLFLTVDIARFITYLANLISINIQSNPTEISLESRRKFLTQSALALASIPFASMIYGITWGKYNFKIRKHTLTFDTLPKVFDGYKIIQISDIHAGSFDNEQELLRGINMINEQKPDIILFTGDLVNNIAEEIDPYIKLFNRLNAKDGIYSCLGNHDYGEYIQWPNETAKKENFIRLKQKHKDLNFKLLLNEHLYITRNNANITIAGVENWGLPPFPQFGDLDKALQNAHSDFTILLSHDPTHWDEKVLKHTKKVDLTLSGHTHGMQFGIEIPGIKWSPIKYKYDKWAGMYQKGNQYLHVNRGFGFLGFPGRVGIWPEITVIELKSKRVDEV